MSIHRFFFMAMVVLIAAGCASKVKTTVINSQTALSENEEVFILSTYDTLPPGAIEVGKIKLGNAGLAGDCDWQSLLNEAKKNARTMGGNIVLITKINPPIGTAPCQKIQARILRVNEKSDIEKIKSSTSTLTDSTWNYSKLYVYRPSGPGMLVGYDLFMNDSLICRVKNA